MHLRSARSAPGRRTGNCRWRAAALAAFLALAPAAAGAQGDASAPPDFGPALAAYGSWMLVPGLGLAWRPASVPLDWAPYRDGSWSWTRRGWYWVTEEPWGEVTYHYGRWTVDPGRGWVWLPGREWATSWVTWRWNRDVVGWAPLPPRGAAPLTAAWAFVPAARLLERQPALRASLPGARITELLLSVRAGLSTGEPPAPGAAAEAAAAQAAGEPVAEDRADRANGLRLMYLEPTGQPSPFRGQRGLSRPGGRGQGPGV